MSLSITNISPSTLQDGDSVTLTGSGFGSSQGSVVIGGVTQSVSAWSDTSITFTAARSGQSMGGCRVDVVKGAAAAYTPTVIVTNQTELNTELAKTAAQLEGQVIGVQYNATAYSISRTQLRKNYGAGGLVITQYGATMPVFSSIAIEQSTALTLHSLEVTSAATSGSLITLYSDSGGVTIAGCEIHGPYNDPNGDMSVYNGGVSGIGTAAGGSNSTGTVTIQDNVVYDVYQGIWVAHAGVISVTGNEVYNTYEDQIRIRLVSAGTVPISVDISWNTLYAIMGLDTDALAPHPDHIDIYGIPSTGDWENITVIGNVIFGGNSRGTGQGIYMANGGGTHKYGATVKGNVVCSGFTRSLSIEDAVNCTVIGNTVVPRDVSQSANTSIFVGDASSSGAHVIKNNVARAISHSGGSLMNNHTFTTQSNAAMSAIFDGATFALADLDTQAEVLANLNMRAGGALDQTINIGAVGSGYVNFTARTLAGGFE